ncbi:hypothetical protein BH10ACT1_BH10ACT1_19620 [soil metagenome]
MTRTSLKAAVLTAALIAGATIAPTAASAALPAPDAGGPAALLRYTGDPSSATGAALANGPCDVDGDGYDDAVVGAWFWDKAPTGNIGATYVLLGGPDVDGASLADPAEAGAVRIDGPATANAFTGFAVACLGDVNGDDLDDIAIGHYTAQKTYVVYGAEEFTGVALDAMGDRGFSVVGGPTSGNVGFSMAPVGDLDEDGLDDFAVAEVGADTLGRTNNGRVWVVAGQDDVADVDLLAPATGQLLLTVDGAINEERLGNIASVGDVNGDGTDDFLLGAYTSTPWGSGIAVPGAAYVVFGGATGTIDTADLGTKGFTIVGPTRQRDRLGISVSGAGDLNGDGLADLLIGADGVANAVTGPRTGGAAVVFGSAGTDRVYTDPLAASGQSVFTCAGTVTEPGACASPVRRGYWIDGAVASDATGYSVAGLGDVDGDDVPDVALGAYGFDPANPVGGAFSGAGAVYVVHGDPSAIVQPLATLAPTAGYRIDGTAAGDRFGRQVGALGDFDGNGVTDLAVGADFAARPAAQNGEVTIALMGQLATAVTLAGPAGAVPGDEVAFTATVTKPAGDPAAVATGTVAFTLSGSPISGCAAVAVTAGSATCTATFGSEVSGDVVASYSGTDLLQASDAPAAAFAVAKQATTTALSASEETPETGQLVQLLAVVTGPAAASAGGGTVAFASAGTAIPGCGSASVSDGTATCTTSWNARGTYPVTARYSGTARLATSTSAARSIVAGADTAVLPQAGKGTYGLTGSTISGQVQGASRIPTGTVTISEGSRALTTAPLSGGRWSVTLGATALAPGTRTLTVAYGGDARHNAATATTTAVVARATAAVTYTVTPAKPKVKTGKVTVTLRVTATGTVPTGTVDVRIDGASARIVTLSSTGQATVVLPAFTTVGKKTFRVVYQGSASVGSSASTVKSVTVLK